MGRIKIGFGCSFHTPRLTLAHAVFEGVRSGEDHTVPTLEAQAINVDLGRLGHHQGDLKTAVATLASRQATLDKELPRIRQPTGAELHVLVHVL